MAHVRFVSASTASTASPATEPSQRAFLVGLYGSELASGPDPRLDELESLVQSAGARVAGRVDHVLRSSRDLCAATYLGRDKAHRVARLAAARDAALVVFDNELSPAQIPGLFVVCSPGAVLLAPAGDPAVVRTGQLRAASCVNLSA